VWWAAPPQTAGDRSSRGRIDHLIATRQEGVLGTAERMKTAFATTTRVQISAVCHDPSHLCEKWRRVCAAAKVEGLHLHDLRAEFASQLSESKVPVEQVRDALGHSSITMTNAYLRSRASLKDTYRKRTQHQARQRMKIVARG
jgi:integrase